MMEKNKCVADFSLKENTRAKQPNYEFKDKPTFESDNCWNSERKQGKGGALKWGSEEEYVADMLAVTLCCHLLFDRNSSSPGEYLPSVPPLSKNSAGPTAAHRPAVLPTKHVRKSYCLHSAHGGQLPATFSLSFTKSALMLVACGCKILKRRFNLKKGGSIENYCLG